MPKEPKEFRDSKGSLVCRARRVIRDWKALRVTKALKALKAIRARRARKDSRGPKATKEAKGIRVTKVSRATREPVERRLMFRPSPPAERGRSLPEQIMSGLFCSAVVVVAGVEDVARQDLIPQVVPAEGGAVGVLA